MSELLAIPDPATAINAQGPWTNRTVAANAARFHLVEAGSGPLVVLLHGFPTYWYTWRHAIPALAQAGYRAVAMDLRGYGGSDKTPHGYDPLSLATDVASVVRSLGERSAIIVGHGWGATIAWTLACTQPELTRAIAAVSMPHPADLRAAITRDRRQLRAAYYSLAYQIPFLPERRLTAHQAERVAMILRERSLDDSWLDPTAEAMFRAAMLSPASAHCAVEYHRWAVRSIPRRDGRAFRAALSAPVTVPVLQVHGTSDPSILVSSLGDSADRVDAPYEQVLIEAGHYPHEEAPTLFNGALISWLNALE